MKINKSILYLAYFFPLLSNTSFSQIGISETQGFVPNSKAVLDVSSTTKGVLISRMTSDQRTAITFPPQGLQVFDTNTKSFWYFDGAIWREMSNNSTASAPYYPSVRLCAQGWMTRNLEVSTYRNGDPIPQVTNNATWAALTTGAWCYFNNDPANGLVYGKLYNWYAVNDPRGLAPEGWHVATDHEWSAASTCFGGDVICGSSLKEIGTAHWAPDIVYNTNSSGLTLLAGAYRNIAGGFLTSVLTNTGYWWTATEKTKNSQANFRYLVYYSDELNKLADNFTLGFSVRCVKD